MSIKIENVYIFGWEASIRGLRSPMNSWDKSDSIFNMYLPLKMRIGNNDLKLMQSLVKAGSDHSKFMRMINVTCDITAPLYWWKEFDTYKVGTVRNSCSTMHKIHSKKFTLDDFSIDDFEFDNDYNGISLSDCFENVVEDCEMYVRNILKQVTRGIGEVLFSFYRQAITNVQRCSLIMRYCVICITAERIISLTNGVIFAPGLNRCRMQRS